MIWQNLHVRLISFLGKSVWGRARSVDDIRGIRRVSVLEGARDSTWRETPPWVGSDVAGELLNRRK